MQKTCREKGERGDARPPDKRKDSVLRKVMNDRGGKKEGPSPAQTRASLLTSRRENANWGTQ